MKEGDLLFVYGTLRKGEGADLSIRSGAEFVTDDYINGNIYNLGSFPGVKTTAGHFCPGSPSVKGEVFKLTDASITRQLDGYEGYPYLYDRIVTETASGLHVWVYTINRECGENELIKSGDWLDLEGTEPPDLSGVLEPQVEAA